ncbi:MAG: 2-amino-4-hydroxy-6-hydroxymethyldihydropteridine diphosphokinase [Arenicella sp.]
MTTAYIGLGSNMGNSKTILNGVVKLLANHESFCMPVVSSFYKTSPVGYDEQPDFINAVVKVDTALEPVTLLKFLMAIEKAVGRKRDPKLQDGPRLIDCDLLLFGREELITEKLTLPHPRMTERLFVLEPLIEIAPKAFIPGFGYAKEVFTKLEESNAFASQKTTKLVA